MTTPKKKKRLRTDLIVAFAAIFISVATLFVYIYQAQIMQSQQHTSVWPYLEWNFTISSEDGYFISIQNKGVGPALIKSAEIQYNGKALSGARELVTEVLGNSSDSLWLFTETVPNRVLAPGEIIKPFHVKGSTPAQKALLWEKFKGFYPNLKYDICYCSIYGDCWTSSGTTVRESICK